jgi:hypothetical protein
MENYYANLESCYINFVKPLLFFVTSVIISLVTPIQDVLCVLAVGFLMNIVTGIVTDVHVNKNDFNLKKAFDAIAQLMFYSALIYYVNNSLTTLHFDDWANKATVWITLMVSYYYLANILRNASLVFPKNQAIKLMYMVLTTKIFTELKHYFRISKEELKQTDQND